MRPSARATALLLLCCTTSADAASRARRSQLQLRVRGGHVKAQPPRLKTIRGGTADPIPTPVPKETPIADAALAGTLAAAAGTVALHPIDTIKTVQQTGLSLGPACSKIWTRGGPAAFYDGVTPYVLGDGLSSAVKFAVYEKLKQTASKKLPEDYIPLARFACAAVAFLCCSVILVPGELLKIRIQNGMYPNIVAGAAQMVRDEGLRGCFTGYRATLFRDVPYTMGELGLYDLLKGFVRRLRRRTTSSSGDELLAAALTGAVVGFATNPLDVVKTRIMTGGGAGPVAVFRSTIAAEGWGSLLNGAGARVFWLAPFTVIYFGVYEWLKRALVRSRAAKA